MSDLKNVIESLLFVSDEPLTLAAIKNVVDIAEAAEIRDAVKELIAEYEDRKGGFSLREIAGGYQFRTRPEHNDWIKRMLKPNPQRLSKASLETLAIIAYKQPIIRSDIEHIRGVDCGGVLRMLMERKLIRILGRKEIPGRPLIYATTKQFLEVFQLRDLKDLPSPKEIEELSRYADEVSGEMQTQSALPFDEEEPELENGETGEEFEDGAEDPNQLARKISEEAENGTGAEAFQPSETTDDAEAREAEDAVEEADRPSMADGSDSEIPAAEETAGDYFEPSDPEAMEDETPDGNQTGASEAPDIADGAVPDNEHPMAADGGLSPPVAEKTSEEDSETRPTSDRIDAEADDNNFARSDETSGKEAPGDDPDGKNA